MTSTTTATDLQALIDWSRRHQSRMGYFAALYHHVGIAVDQAVAEGKFAHPDELLRLKEGFLARYATAFVAFRDGAPATAPWETSFRAAATRNLCVLQHLLLGINAHINYDLPIAVSTAVAPAELESFRGDFEYMNAILASLVNDMAADLALVFRPLGVINRLFRREDKLLVETVMGGLRESAWRHALRLSTASPAERDAVVAELAREAGGYACVVTERHTPVRLVMRAIAWCERGTVAQIIDDLMRR
jgi:hypothetical protein